MEYLRSKIVAKSSLYAVFNKTEEFENKLNKDVSEFNQEEAVDMLRKFNLKSPNSLLNYIIILKHYSRWATQKIGINAYEFLGKNDAVNLINKDRNILLSRSDLDDIEDNLLNWSDKAIVELLWEGVSGKGMIDLFSVSESCIYGNKLNVNNKEYVLTDKLNYLLPKAFDETELISYGYTMKSIPVCGKGRIYKERPNAQGILNEDKIFRFFYRKIQVFRDYLSMPDLTMKNITASGLFYYLKLNMQKYKLNARDFLRTNEGKKLAMQYGFGDHYVEVIYQKFEQYL